MIKKEEMIKELTRLNEYKRIKVQGTEKERLVFINSDEMFKLFGSEAKGVLTPFDDYTYEWLNSLLYDVIGLIKYNDFEDVEELGESIQDVMHEWVDSEVDVYYSGLTEWLNHSNGNIYYLEEVVKEGVTENILMVAQYKATEELFNNALLILFEYLRDNYEEE
jgi:hypothetical protein